MRVRIRGTVQGVGFRPTVYRVASSMGLSGRVWNDGPDVLVDTDGGREFLDALMSELPAHSRVDSVEADPAPYAGGPGFSIAGSEPGSKGVGIPTDTAICAECLEEMRSSGRRGGYPFTTCTKCGPRFTLISGMPYDRERTAMGRFPVCPECGREYSDPSDRRFHHQTVCCPACGPRYRLVGAGGRPVPGDPIPTFAAMLDGGGIGIAKSWGGMHICAALESAGKLRRWYGREQKPFAIMVRDADAARRYCDFTGPEMEHLTSDCRPIVLADKRDPDALEEVAPGLDNVGVFLPYSGMQHLLFDSLSRDALIMTSANAPGEPMVLDDAAAVGMGADMCLLHDQEIVNRADDSVLRLYGSRCQFIRKSRGHIPSFVGTPLRGDAVGIGAQENLTATVACGGRMYPTQHIGNGGSVGVAEYLEEAADSMIAMTGCEPLVVAEDMHPGYSNRRYGRRLAERFGAELVEVQHHWAHAAALLADQEEEEEAVVIAVDGTGYGTDGNAWGGEVLRASLDGFERVAHLQYIPLLGSERALSDLRRLRFAIDCLNGEDSGAVAGREAEVMRKMLGRSVLTSSLGRVLDALSFSLGVCARRTYDGEPAMKLEPLLRRGRLIPGFEARAERGTVMTAELFSGIPEGARREDVAYSAVRGIVRALADAACDDAIGHGIGCVGLTGGVSYSGPICHMAEEAVAERGLRFITNERIPNGDGGISTGQAAIALRRLG